MMAKIECLNKLILKKENQLNFLMITLSNFVDLHFFFLTPF